MDMGVVLLALFFLYIMWSEISSFLSGDEPCPEGQERLELGAPCTDIVVPPTIAERAQAVANTATEGLQRAIERGPTKQATKDWGWGYIKTANTPDNWAAQLACRSTSRVHGGTCSTSGGHDLI
tara:strand:- start:155 stop:526 length:372 start_codon:yes stop_codon:yes gene_type:complete